MKKLLLVAATAGLMAAPAIANAAGGDVIFQGERAIVCDVTNLAPSVDFGNLGNKGQAVVQTMAGVGLFCNQPSDVTFESERGYLALIVTDANNASVSESDFTSINNPGFDAGLDYKAWIPSVGGIGADTSLLTAGVPSPALGIPAQNVNSANLKFDTINSANPLLGGTYTDKITVTITPTGV